MVQLRDFCALSAIFMLAGCPAKSSQTNQGGGGATSKPKTAATKKADSSAKAPAHYFNPKENLNPDPNYVPGDYPAPDTAAAVKAYEAQKATVAGTAGKTLKTTGEGELNFGIAKNEKKRVFGYFRDFSGTVTLGDAGPTKVEMVVNVNSLDTAVPGRDNRIKKIFFDSIKPDLGTAKLTLDKLDMGGKSWADAEKEGLAISASGSFNLNGATQPVSAKLSVKKEGDGYEVELTEKLLLKISDFGFKDRIFALMKECNHKSIGNVVDIGGSLKLK